MGKLYDVAMQWNRRSHIVLGIYDDYTRDRRERPRIEVICSKGTLMKQGRKCAVRMQNMEEMI